MYLSLTCVPMSNLFTYDLQVVDLETDKSLPVNCEGELYFHGPNVMKGYWKNQAASDDCMDGEWFRTGL